MDEPVANLDPKARAEFFMTLTELKKRGKAIFVSSHVLAELDLYFDSATILDGGRIVFSGNKNKLDELYTEQTYTCEVSKPEVVKK
jgi:ABC-2 type transport system ATP-binding protein